jgi:putative ABC transport system permease protein
MKFLPLIWSGLRRKKIRTVVTVFSVLVAFVLFAYLAAIKLAFSLGVDVAGADRLALRHKVSLVQLLPESYQSRLEAMPGVVAVAHATWFGGIYKDRKNFFAQLPVEPERFLDLYPEYVLPPERVEAWKANRAGAVVGRETAERFGFEIGDRIPIQGTIWRKADGGAWELVIEGIYEGAEPGVDETMLLFHYDYFDEAREALQGMVGWYILRIDDPERASEIAANIDATFANSLYETKTSTEKAWVQSFADQIGNIGAILRAVLTAVFFTILLVAGNTMAQSVRERTGELAVLKTVGFSNVAVLAFVLAESLVLACAGGLTGLGLGWLMITVGGDPTGGFLGVFYVRGGDLLIGVALAIGLGLAAGLLPAVQAMRLRIVDALRRV